MFPCLPIVVSVRQCTAQVLGPKAYNSSYTLPGTHCDQNCSFRANVDDKLRDLLRNLLFFDRSVCDIFYGVIASSRKSMGAFLKESMKVIEIVHVIHQINRFCKLHVAISLCISTKLWWFKRLKRNHYEYSILHNLRSSL